MRFWKELRYHPCDVAGNPYESDSEREFVSRNNCSDKTSCISTEPEIKEDSDAGTVLMMTLCLLTRNHSLHSKINHNIQIQLHTCLLCVHID